MAIPIPTPRTGWIAKKGEGPAFQGEGVHHGREGVRQKWCGLGESGPRFNLSEPTHHYRNKGYTAVVAQNGDPGVNTEYRADCRRGRIVLVVGDSFRDWRLAGVPKCPKHGTYTSFGAGRIMLDPFLRLDAQVASSNFINT